MPNSSPPAVVWVPLAIVASVVAAAGLWGVESSVWALAGLALIGAVLRAGGSVERYLGSRRRSVDVATLAFFGAALAYLASSGVLN